jgi:hypothetical protein
MSDNNGYSWRDHSRLFLACGIVILSPFQYGFDFGMIGGLQAMVGFLKVLQDSPPPPRISWLSCCPDLRLPNPQNTHRMEHHNRATATHLLTHDPRRLHQLRHRRYTLHAFR